MEIPTSLMNQVKLRLRIDHYEYDDEIEALILAGIGRLEQVGIHAESMLDDPLVIHAVALFAKGQFGYDNPDADRFDAAFEAFLLGMKIDPRYTEEEVIP